MTSGMLIEVHVRPGARRNHVGGSHDGALAVAVTAPPADGRANDAVCTAVAAAFAIRPSAVTLVRGHTSRRKTLRVDLAEGVARVRLADLTAAPASASGR